MLTSTNIDSNSAEKKLKYVQKINTSIAPLQSFIILVFLLLSKRNSFVTSKFELTLSATKSLLNDENENSRKSNVICQKFLVDIR